MVIYEPDGGFFGLFFGPFSGPFSGILRLFLWPFSGPFSGLFFSLFSGLCSVKKQPDISVRPHHIFHHPITGSVLSFFNKFMESRNPPQSPVIPAPWPPYGLCHGFSQGVEETSRFSSPGISTLSSASKSPSPNSSAPPYPYLHPINAVSLAFAASLS